MTTANSKPTPARYVPLPPNWKEYAELREDIGLLLPPRLPWWKRLWHAIAQGAF
jgi:hypothetical protein